MNQRRTPAIQEREKIIFGGAIALSDPQGVAA
jgi:hypothetical protein